jgi:hypothetical protein
MRLNIMSKYFQKTKKKLGQGIKSLTKMESKTTDQLFWDSDTQKFLVLHFGTGNEVDYKGITSFLSDEVKLLPSAYNLGNKTKLL